MDGRKRCPRLDIFLIRWDEFMTGKRYAHFVVSGDFAFSVRMIYT